MTNDRTPSTARRRSARLAVLAVGLALAAPAAWAQSTPDKAPTATERDAAPAQPGAEPAPWPGAAPVPPNNLEGVTVNAQRPQSGNAIPDDKAAAYTAEVAKAKAWQDYRKSTPRATSDPNDLSKDYPGLQTLLPEK